MNAFLAQRTREGGKLASSAFNPSPPFLQSLRHTPLGVKTTQLNPPRVPSIPSSRKGGFRRHLDGWQLGLLSVSIALLALALTLPRKVAPDVLPLPNVDRVEQGRETARARGLVELAHRQGLPFEIRAVGEAVRRFGSAEAEHDGPRAASELATLRRALGVARARHPDALLLRLRAVQTSLFSDAVAAWERTRAVGQDLRELGGTFLENATAFGWLEPPAHFVLDASEREILFELRWNELLGLEEARPFAFSLNEWRRYYHCLLRHPQVARSAPDGDAARARLSLRYVESLSQRDPEFPAALASGVLHHRLGANTQASSDFRAHLAAHPHGRWFLRARNYWLSAAAASAQGPE